MVLFKELFSDISKYQTVLNKIFMFTIFANFVLITILWSYVIIKDLHTTKRNEIKAKEYKERMAKYDTLTVIEQQKQDTLYMRQVKLLEDLEKIKNSFYDEKRP